jgi:hypothetical protein
MIKIPFLGFNSGREDEVMTYVGGMGTRWELPKGGGGDPVRSTSTTPIDLAQ